MTYLFKQSHVLVAVIWPLEIAQEFIGIALCILQIDVRSPQHGLIGGVVRAFR